MFLWKLNIATGKLFHRSKAENSLISLNNVMMVLIPCHLTPPLLLACLQIYFFLLQFVYLKYIITPQNNLDLYCWAEITGQRTQTSNTTDTKAIDDQWLGDQLVWKLFDHFGPPSKHHPERTMLNFRDIFG